MVRCSGISKHGFTIRNASGLERKIAISIVDLRNGYGPRLPVLWVDDLPLLVRPAPDDVPTIQVWVDSCSTVGVGESERQIPFCIE